MPKFFLNRRIRNIPTNPTLEFANQILEEAKKFHATEIESEGGGSVIDVAKYVAWKLNIPHAAIPTTAGTGSEVTKYAVFIDNNRKIAFEDTELIPDKYILDADKLTTLPPEIIASTGLDALSQSIESWWSPLATEGSRRFAEKSVRKILDNLYNFYKNPNNEVCGEQMLIAANYSGRAINTTRTSICHAVSYPLTIFYNIPHGFACAYTLPYFVKLFKPAIIHWQQIEILLQFLDFKKIPVNKEKDADEALAYPNAQNTPIKVTKKMILEALCL